MNISEYGKGALKTSKLVRDQQFRLAAVLAAIDWSQPFHVPAILNQRDQKSSSSCTSQATGYYTEVLNQVENHQNEKHSNRYVYSQVYIPPEGGAYIWKAMSIPLRGTASANSVPDGDSTEATMRDSSLNSQAVIEAITDKYAVIPRSNIDQMAQVVKDYHGFVTGFNGRNDMFSPDGTANPFTGPSEWGHAVYVCGFEIRNGKKCLKFKNSWSSDWGSGGYGYFPEEFVNSGLLFDCYTYANIKDLDPTSMNNRFVTVDGQKDVWLVRDGKRSLIYNALAFVLVSNDWSKIEKITQAQLSAIPDTGKVLAGLDQE